MFRAAARGAALGRRPRTVGVLVVALVVALGTLTTSGPSSGSAPAGPCGLRYVASGDGVASGEDASDSERYSEILLNDRLTKVPGPRPGPWCLTNTAKDGTTTTSFVNDGNPTQMSQAWNLKPTLITLTLGRQNASIVNQIGTCFDNVKDHEFLQANTCALAILADSGAWTKLRNDLSAILNTYKTQMAGSPSLVIAVTGYFNPYPSGTSVATQIPGFCADLVDVIPTCIARWIQLPPALVILDQVVQKLNSTIKPVVDQFRQSSQGRFFFVNPYDAFKDHCMHMKVRIDISVYHPPSTVDHHNNDEDFGCEDESWIASDGKVGTASPFLYLTPAVDGVLLTAVQTTREMGYNPNKDGHDCISDLIWDAVKNKLGVPEKPASGDPCA